VQQPPADHVHVQPRQRLQRHLRPAPCSGAQMATETFM
jgi:hypothetical protein